MLGLRIKGSGKFIPGAPVTNDDLSLVMDTNNEWIKPRSGIEQRHFVADGQGVSDLGKEAALLAIKDAGIKLEAIDYIICATMTPEHVFPGSGVLIGSKLGIPGVPALDIRQQCAAVPFGLQVAQGLLSTGAAKTILFVGGEAHAGFMPWDWDALEKKEKPTQEAYDFATKHRGVSVLFGDGAGAWILEPSDHQDAGLIGVSTHSDGRAIEQVWIPGGLFSQKHYWTASPDSCVPHMQGKELFKSAVTLLPLSVRELCKKYDVDLGSIDWFIAHQANDRINDFVRQNLGLPQDKVPSNIAKYGNTSAGTIPILLDEMAKDGRLKRGQLVCMMALGAGLNWGSVLMRY